MHLEQVAPVSAITWGTMGTKVPIGNLLTPLLRPLPQVDRVQLLCLRHSLLIPGLPMPGRVSHDQQDR
jgi:hypothetical protein